MIGRLEILFDNYSKCSLHDSSSLYLRGALLEERRLPLPDDLLADLDLALSPKPLPSTLLFLYAFFFLEALAKVSSVLVCAYPSSKSLVISFISC